MKKALEYILSQLVDNPEKIVIEEKEEDGIVNFSITVDPTEMGKVIGKGGKVIRSVRNVLKILAIKEGKHVNISLIDPQVT